MKFILGRAEHIKVVTGIFLLFPAMISFSASLKLGITYYRLNQRNVSEKRKNPVDSRNQTVAISKLFVEEKYSTV